MNVNEDQFSELGQQNRYRPQYSSWQQGMTNPFAALRDTFGSGATTKRNLRNEAKKRFLFGSIDSAVQAQSTLDSYDAIAQGVAAAQTTIDPTGENPSKRIASMSAKQQKIDFHGASTYVPTTKKKNKGRGKGKGDMPPGPTPPAGTGA